MSIFADFFLDTSMYYITPACVFIVAYNYM